MYKQVGQLLLHSTRLPSTRHWASHSVLLMEMAWAAALASTLGAALPLSVSSTLHEDAVFGEGEEKRDLDR